MPEAQSDEHSMSTRRAGLGQVLVLMIGSCLPVLGAVLVAPLLPRIRAEFAGHGAVDVLVPMVIAAPALFIALISPWAGLLADKIGRKRILLIALPLYSLVGLAPIWLHSLPLIVASRFALGVTEAVIMTVCTALIGDYTAGARRERLLSLQTIATSVSAVLFVILGGALGEDAWRAPFWLYAGGLVLAPFAAALLWEPLAERDNTIDAAPPLPWGALATVCALTLIGAIGFYIVPSQIAYLLESAGTRATSAAGAANGAAQAAILAGAVAFNFLGRLRLGTCLALAFVVSGAGLLGLGLARTPGALVAFAVINGFGLGVMLPTLLKWTMRLVVLSQRGRGAGGFVTFFFLGQFLSPLLVVALSAGTGALTSAIVVVGAVTIATCVPAFIAARSSPESAPPESRTAVA